MIRHFVNLSGGIEAIEQCGLVDFEIVRISSTDCQSVIRGPHWEAILAELDANFLMALARGDECYVYDSSKAGQSDAQRWGLAWIRFVLNAAWFAKVTRPVMIDGKDRSGLFSRTWRKIGKRTKGRISYFRNFLAAEEIHLETICVRAKHDGKWAYYREALDHAKR